MIAVANILADVHRARLDHDNIDKVFMLRMSTRLMERVQHKEAFTSIVFRDALSDEHSSANEEWKY